MCTVQRKETWWNELRVKNNISYAELVEYTGYSLSAVASVFSGEHLPNQELADKLYLLFDVDPVIGDLHFQEANLVWESDRTKTAVQVNGRSDINTEDSETVESVRKAPKPRYLTWWTQYIKDQNIQYKDIAETLGCSSSAVGNWVCGKFMPKPDVIRKFCDLFGLCFEEAQMRFREAYTEWARMHEEKPNEVRDASSVANELSDEPDTLESGTDNQTAFDEEHTALDDCGTATVEVSASEVEALLENLYGVLDCEEFLAVHDALTKTHDPDVLKYLYNKIDVRNFIKIKDFLS